VKLVVIDKATVKLLLMKRPQLKHE